MRIFKNSWFARYARKESISDDVLCATIARASRSLIDADLGSGLIKQRMAREGEGKSGGYRSIIVYKSRSNAFFVFGFAKSERENLTPSELVAFKQLAIRLSQLADADLHKQIEDGILMEILENGQVL